MSAFGTSLFRQQARSLLRSVRHMPAYNVASSSRSALPVLSAPRALSTSQPRPEKAPAPANKQQDTEVGGTYSSIINLLNDGYKHTRKNAAVRPGDDRMDYAADLEADWSRRNIQGEASWPATPSSGRSIPVTAQADAARAYGQLAVLLRRNNVRNELRLQQRHEKPNEERRRKKSERHRRRFADMVRKKVQLVMAIKARGA